MVSVANKLQTSFNQVISNIVPFGGRPGMLPLVTSGAIRQHQAVLDQVEAELESAEKLREGVAQLLRTSNNELRKTAEQKSSVAEAEADRYTRPIWQSLKANIRSMIAEAYPQAEFHKNTGTLNEASLKLSV